MKKFSLLFTLLLTMLSHNRIQAQAWPCNYNWAPGNGIGTDCWQPIPQNAAINAGPGAQLSFTLRFSDLDQATGDPACASPGPHNLEVTPFGHQITLTTSNVMHASFNAANSGVANTVVGATAMAPLSACGSPENGALYTSAPVMVFVNAAWTATDPPITITATITDNTPLPAGHTGNITDQNVTHTWTINFDDVCPDTIMHTGGTAGGIWVDHPGGVQPLCFEYQVGPDIGPPGQPDYQGKIILETFGPPTASFTMADLQPAWVMANGIVDANQAAAFLFSGSVGANSSFILDANDSLEDCHGVFDASQVGVAFLPASLQASAAGFSFTQDYSCNGNSIGDANISKRLHYFPVTTDYGYQTNKTHNF